LGPGHGTKVGEGQTDVVTRKDLIVRLQAPRFFVEKDEVVLSANVHNYLKSKKTVHVVLELGGQSAAAATPEAKDRLAAAATPDAKDRLAAATPDAEKRLAAAGTAAQNPLSALDPLTRTIEVKPNGEARVDWHVKVLDEGEAIVRMKALTDEESDAMEQKFPCYVHGMLKMEARSGVVRPNQPGGKMSFTVPAQRRPKQTRLEVRYSPTLAGAMVDALPYLVDYPYGCTEQTLSRFLPTVITQKVLIEMGVNLEEVQKKRTNLNAQEIGDDQDRAKQWNRLKPGHPHPGPLLMGEGTDRNPVFDRQESIAWSRRASSGSPRCSFRTAAGAGSPATASIRRRTPRPTWSTASNSPSTTTWPWCPA